MRIALSNGPPEEVRALFEEAAAAFERMFALRGTSPPFRVVVTSQDPGMLGDAELRAGEAPTADETDESYTNSCKGLRAVYLALAAGAFARARRLAREIWDPPGAEDSPCRMGGAQRNPSLDGGGI